jgi:hypothetical protein
VLRSLLVASKAVSTVESSLKSSLTMILVDTPSIDLKLRNADIVSTFINYMPGIMASQMVPYLDIKFSLRRSGTEKNQKERPQTVMSPLKFLLGSQPIQDGSADALIYDTYTTSIVKEKITVNAGEVARRQREAAEARAKQQGKTLAPFDLSKLDVSTENGETVETTTTGMEMFLMPQTLINMDYDQENVPRYNEVLNQTLPFGTILSFNINVTSAGYGVFSYKTGVLTLKIFDRSRLVEIADFLNPKLYGQATLWITYGWRAPGQPNAGLDRNEYLAMINENMLKKEAFGISNSSISIGDDGTATVTLNLFMKFAQELSQVTPIEGSAYFDATQQNLETKLVRIKELAEGLGLTSSGAKDIRGGIILQSALGGNLPTLDAKAVADEMSAIQGAFNNSTNPDAKEFINLAREIYAISEGGSKSSVLSNQEHAAQAVAMNRFDKLKVTSDKDVWSVISGDVKDNNKFKGDPTDVSRPTHPLSEMHKLLAETKITSVNGQSIDQSVFGRFGDVSFARLFSTYFASAARTLTDYTNNPEIDEYQIIFYNFNQFAGTVANVNIGEFPIDMDILIKSYTEHVTKQKGEKMNLLNFLEIVRSSQFGNQKHKAFGFSDLYDDKGEFKKTHTDELLKRQMENRNLGSAFIPPAVDFYVETSNSDSDTSIQDLLTVFEAGSTITTSGKKPDGFKKIVRIHIYDKASIPHKAAHDILRDDSGAFIEVESAWKNDYLKAQNEILTKINSENTNNPNAKKKAFEAYDEAQKDLKISKVDTQIDVEFGGTKVSSKVRSVSFKDARGNARFNLAKREISRFVPTLTIGTNGTLIKSINYGSEQDARLSTIMMLRNSSATENPSLPNGSSTGDLPLRVVPGKLSMTTMGCPLFEYMQQFFIDLGTGTTIDNLYNITGLSHNISPGGFTTEIHFTFADAYGKYESPKMYIDQMKAIAETLRRKAKESTGVQQKPQFSKKK